ncbi:hypothetical protein SKAU_G00164410 [Synaphobranchus kaupii]|uniref:Uncharacterized protein n=1 Tax=Synaphobranchus kaupii TaxID=118154 RepID=A0A9Q1FJB8_SYNKA|nr:hypothetical protein SKAU_G00164410 [Synaphobranchus kaupii]
MAESTLGLHWHCQTDTLRYKYRPVEKQAPTMRMIYRTLASQYDPLGYIVPFTTRAKILIQQLWDKQRDWDDPHLPANLLQAWHAWEDELQHLEKIRLPRCYVIQQLWDISVCARDIHVFCDASERAYGSVGYLRTENSHGQVQVAFLAARSRVAPKKQLSIPRLKLCAVLTQLARLLGNYLGYLAAEIQELTDVQAWRYVPSEDNPADDLTCGRTLLQLSEQTHWNQGP